MLVWIIALVVCLVSVIVAVMVMRARGKNRGGPELNAMRAAVASEVRGKTVDQAVAHLRATRPGIRVIVLPAGQDYSGPDVPGYAVVFNADSGSEKVETFDIGLDGFWISWS